MVVEDAARDSHFSSTGEELAPFGHTRTITKPWSRTTSASSLLSFLARLNAAFSRLDTLGTLSNTDIAKTYPSRDKSNRETNSVGVARLLSFTNLSVW
jgi:hypothetical protein